MRELQIGQKVFHRINGRIFDYVAGGVGFSASLGHYLCVLGKRGAIGRDAGINKFHILWEGGHSRLEQFLMILQNKQNSFDIQDNLIGNPSRIIGTYLMRFNRRTGNPVTIREPAFLDPKLDIRYFTERLIDRVNPSRQTLFFPDDSVVKMKLKGLDMKEQPEQLEPDHPEIAALGYALDAIESKADFFIELARRDPVTVKPAAKNAFPWQHTRGRKR